MRSGRRREGDKGKKWGEHTKDGAAGAGHCLVGRRCLRWNDGCDYRGAFSRSVEN
jgi:hypothetical protein